MTYFIQGTIGILGSPQITCEITIYPDEVAGLNRKEVFNLIDERLQAEYPEADVWSSDIDRVVDCLLWVPPTSGSDGSE